MNKFDYDEFERELAIDRRYRNIILEEYYRRDMKIEKMIDELNKRMRYILIKGNNEIEIRGRINRDILKSILKEGYLPIE